MVIRKMEVYVLDIIMEVALACVISAGGIGGIIIAVVKSLFYLTLGKHDGIM